MKNLMFDLGGVIMEIERRRAVDALKAIGLNDANEMLGEYGQQGYSDLWGGLVPSGLQY